MSQSKSIQISSLQFALLLVGALILTVAVFRRDLYQSIHKPDLLISEIMAVNYSTRPDSDLDYSDWIEIHNPGTEAINLGGWFLTDDFRNIKKWAFPELMLEPHGYLIVYASGKNRTSSPSDLHTNFSLSQEGEYLALVKPDGKTVEHEYQPKFPPQEGDISFGLRANLLDPTPNKRANGGIRKHAYFVTPTPGEINTGEKLGTVADTKFSHNRGFYFEPIAVTISTKTPDADIYYSLDGTVPTPETGIMYTRPISIRNTSILRAVAHKPNHQSTNVDTHTYVFAEQVARQTGRGFPETWGYRNQLPVKADYEMDPEIVEHPSYRNSLLAALAALPALSVVMDSDDLFDSDNGIYSNPMLTGSDWEKPASVELIHPEGSKGFQINCGIRIQGGWSRRPEESPKHSFRLEFRTRYGFSWLNYPLFGEDGVDEFKTLILRAGCNNSWLHWNGQERRQGDLLRDQFMRDSLRALGHASSRGTFVHLFLNGLYWGIYNPCERPNHYFMATHLGENPLRYESRNASNVLNGSEETWNRIFELANTGLANPTAYQELQQLLDVDQFIDFMIVQIYGGTSDWDRASNWYAGRRVRSTGKYQFYIWDSERSLEGVDVSILTLDDARSPTRLFQALRKNPDFRPQFGSRAFQHLASNGALSPSATTVRFRDLANRLQPAIVAESARWGDYRRDVHPYREGPYELYTVDDHWQPEIDRLLNDYLPNRTRQVLHQIVEADLN